MTRNWKNTETVKYFLQKYKRATVSAAAELAAEQARDMLSDGFKGTYRLPVNIERLSELFGIKHAGIWGGEEDSRLGILFFDKDKYKVKIRPGGSIARDRFTLAHEIGHCLFREKQKHQIQSIAFEEREAEENISTMFATALLMPIQSVQQVLEKMPNEGPWEIVKHLEKSSLKFGVSIPAMLLRLGQTLSRRSPSLILLCLQYFVNYHTKTLPRLRVLICSRLGNLSNIRTWFNRSAEGLGLFSANILFSQWVQFVEEGNEKSGGRYTIDSDGGLVSAGPSKLYWIPQELNFTVYTNGVSQKQTIQVRAVSVLYARQGWQKHQAYVVSIIKIP